MSSKTPTTQNVLQVIGFWTKSNTYYVPRKLGGLSEHGVSILIPLLPFPIVRGRLLN